MSKTNFGVFGLGVMGKNISINIAKKKHKLSVYNRIEGNEANVVSDFLSENTALKNIEGYTTVQSFVSSIAQPRKILLMVNAGKTVDLVIESLLPFLDKNDIIIDGGNSHYEDSKIRYQTLKSQDLHFISCGISGGAEGARKGPSMMPSGDKDVYALVAPILETIAAKDKNNQACCAYLGEESAGHFIKMVHNGIEYSEMQLIAEMVALLSQTMSYEAIVKVFNKWKKNDLDSYLLDITCKILETKEGNNYVLDLILDSASNKGTGSWSTKAALELGVPNTMMSAAVFARYISTFKKERITFSAKKTNKINKVKKLNIEALERTYEFSRIINHHQGFELLSTASEANNWNLNISEITRVWMNGCIIKSSFLNVCYPIFKHKSYLLSSDLISSKLYEAEEHVNNTMAYILANRVAAPCVFGAYTYWVSLTTKQSSANLIQAQRDFFGAHGYERIDSFEKGKKHHTNWE